jgi:hypothetical protein
MANLATHLKPGVAQMPPGVAQTPPGKKAVDIMLYYIKSQSVYDILISSSISFGESGDSFSGLLRKTEHDSGLPFSCFETPNSNFRKKSSFENGIFDVLAGGLIRQTTLLLTVETVS